MTALVTRDDLNRRRLMSRVERPDEGCWEWQGSRNNQGYGQFYWNGRPGLAHRASWELWIGPIPAGLEIDHMCRNPACIRPGHLQPVTHKENIRRAYTSCKRGHPLTPEHGYRQANSDRWQCRTCRRFFGKRKRTAA